MFKNFYYAFVQFQKLEHAKKVLAEMRYPEFAGVKCRALPFNKFSLPSAGGQVESRAKRDSVNLFVKGLPKSWTHEDLSKAFEDFGTVISSKVSIDQDHKSRGYGFVSLSTQDAATKAIDQLHDKALSELEGAAADEADLKLSVCEYVPKLDREGTQQQKCSTNLYVKNFPAQPNDAEYTED